jgi:transposase-like protein
MTFLEFNKKFPTEKAALDYFYLVKYNNILACPHCGKKTRLCRTARPKVCICHNCENTFSPFSDTIFEKSTTDLRKWFYAVHLVLNAKKGISACQLQREIGTIYRTAWRMLQQIRIAMGNTDMSKAFEAFVEIDETYAGGKPRKENVKFDENGNKIIVEEDRTKRGRGTKKTPVVGVKERSTKRVYAQVALPNENGQKLSGKQLLNILDKVCKDETTVISDDFTGYNILEKKHKNNFVHLTVNHSAGEFAVGNIHTNNIESFWSCFKRAWYGTYHHFSVKYMQRYVDECCFRSNNREISASFDTLLVQTVMKKTA